MSDVVNRIRDYRALQAIWEDLLTEELLEVSYSLQQVCTGPSWILIEDWWRDGPQTWIEECPSRAHFWGLTA